MTEHFYLRADSDTPVGPFSTPQDAEEAASTDNRLAMDKSMRHYDVDKRLHIGRTHVSKANICAYLGREIPKHEELGLNPDRMYQLLRDPEELAKAAPTFNNLPVLSRHVAVTADSHEPDLVVGSLGTDSEFSDPYLDNSMVIWSQEAIDGIEDDSQREVSSAYRYRADMTPGTYKGAHYDGVMRDIRGNHVALVRTGRAGSDVLAADSAPQLEKDMTKKTALSPKAVQVEGALIAHLQPVLAQDSKPDFKSILMGTTTKTYKDEKPKIAKALKPFIAKDGEAPLAKLLDALDDAAVPEAKDMDANAAVPVKDVTQEDIDTPEDPNAGLDAEPWEKTKEMLKGKGVAEDVLAACDEIMKPTGEAPMKKPAEDAEPEKKDMIDKPAMDSAIRQATAKVKTDMAAANRALRVAEREVEPYVGELADSLAFDSAAEVYKAALESMDIDLEGVPESGYRSILRALPVPNRSASLDVPLAMDEDALGDFNKMYGTSVSRIASV